MPHGRLWLASIMSRFDILFGFDMESDIGSWTPFHEGLRFGTPRILDVFHRHEITGTFYFVGQSARAAPESVREVKRAGHEIGAHSLFHETVGDALFPIPGDVPLLPHEVKARLQLNTQWIEEICGQRPVSFRSPRLFGSTAVCNALEALGYISDASYPLYFYRERLEPYHPAAGDWTQEGNLRLIEIPNFADMSLPSNDPHGRDRDQWPLFRTESADKLLHHVDNYLLHLKANGIRNRVLAFYFHPWEFHPMPQGVIEYGEGGVAPAPFLTKNCGDYALSQLKRLTVGLKARGGVFRTAAQIADKMSPAAFPS